MPLDQKIIDLYQRLNAFNNKLAYLPYQDAASLITLITNIERDIFYENGSYHLADQACSYVFDNALKMMSKIPQLTHQNFSTYFMSSVLVATKNIYAHDAYNLYNEYFSRVVGIPLKKVHQMESELVKAIDFEIPVPIEKITFTPKPLTNRDYLEKAATLAENYEKRSRFFTVGMKDKARKIRQAIRDAEQNIESLVDINSVATYKKTRTSLSVHEALSSARKFGQSEEGSNLLQQFIFKK